ncbi:unnamed protein product [Adineta steineri]|uniref:Helix-turn-helix domain-containing protein n=1 Tax=Adineta steineri TaxID=433720 RepID=A0A815VIG1_9BILA|nr:unnamed protein product [Adineta steineri]CAF4213371.1 unnamed protein product [Adineta steineri]
MAQMTTLTSSFELLQKLEEWSTNNLKQETLLCTIDVVDLYTMIPQVGGVLSLKKMLDHLNLKQINSLKTEVIIRLARFVMTNTYFKAIRYSSTFEAYQKERDPLRMTLLLNQYPRQFIDQQFNHVFYKYVIKQQINIIHYHNIRQQIINSPLQAKEPINYGQKMFIHFTYCSSMKNVPHKFHNLWLKYFSESPINGITLILGTRNVNNLEQRLVHTRDS